MTEPQIDCFPNRILHKTTIHLRILARKKETNLQNKQTNKQTKNVVYIEQKKQKQKSSKSERKMQALQMKF